MVQEARPSLFDSDRPSFRFFRYYNCKIHEGVAGALSLGLVEDPIFTYFVLLVNFLYF